MQVSALAEPEVNIVDPYPAFPDLKPGIANDHKTLQRLDWQQPLCVWVIRGDSQGGCGVWISTGAL